ncbi:porin [Comamonas thiooxydans]|uniref:porin n=1 Tax=Comamonas thiooxydans TaxID=363952 RepID=UPI000710E7FD|nr:porin [Comamonas thiooxydans]
MKKTIPALAAWAVCTCACVQSDVSIFGTIDTYIARAKSGNSSTMRIDSGGNTASRIGFRGKEDLGGGMSARFMLEAGIDSDTGAGNPTSSFAFTRQSFGISRWLLPVVRSSIPQSSSTATASKQDATTACR